MTQPAEEIALHICPKCKRDVASGRDARGLLALCSTCDGQIKLLATRLRILPSFRHKATSRLQRRNQ
jgi:ribosomal protein L37AE/L43A